MKEKIRNEARVVTKGRECENDNGLHRFQFALLGYHGARILIEAARHKQSYVSVTIALHSDGILFSVCVCCSFRKHFNKPTDKYLSVT